jgi:hypothetical protein
LSFVGIAHSLQQALTLDFQWRIMIAFGICLDDKFPQFLFNLQRYEDWFRNRCAPLGVFYLVDRSYL